MLAFECTPFSFHSFLHNHRHPRNSFILWLHRRREEVAQRWGAERIAMWPKEH